MKRPNPPHNFDPSWNFAMTLRRSGCHHEGVDHSPQSTARRVSRFYTLPPTCAETQQCNLNIGKSIPRQETVEEFLRRKTPYLEKPVRE